MTIKRAITWGKRVLSELHFPLLEVEVLLSHILNTDRAFLKANNERKLSMKECWKFRRGIKKRRKNIPLAYIIHTKLWGGISIYVNKNVLIPRDETEILCTKITQKKRGFLPRVILDIGTGSGCIALYLKKHWMKARVIALDKSKKALHVAQKNAQKHQLSIEFLYSNLLSNISQNSSFDIIVANLPYVPELQSVSPEVQKEPPNAIFSGVDGLEHIRCLAHELKKKNIHYQELWLEFLPSQKKSITHIFKNQKIQFLGDISESIFFACITT